MSDYLPGLYECISIVQIRREPKIVEHEDINHHWVTNVVGKISVGTQRQVYSIITDGMNMTWGRISESDAAGIAQWVCIKGLNREYMKPLDDGTFDIGDELKKLIAWARTKGYTG